MKKLKEILMRLNDYKFIILIILIIGGTFYWFELRPNIIRKQCSWYEYVTQIPAVPAVLEQKSVTKEEAEKLLPELLSKYDKKPVCDGSSRIDCFDLFVWESNKPTVDKLISQYKPAVPAIQAGPEVKNWRNSTEKEYNDCLRHRGIIK